MNYAECEVVADAGVRLRIIADGMYRIASGLTMTESEATAWQTFARHVDEVRVRLCALPLEAEGEAA